jgi:hypothetical protein
MKRERTDEGWLNKYIQTSIVYFAHLITTNTPLNEELNFSWVHEYMCMHNMYVHSVWSARSYIYMSVSVCLCLYVCEYASGCIGVYWEGREWRRIGEYDSSQMIN